MPRIVAISDTHGNYPFNGIPDGDILIHAGDITLVGGYGELSKFNKFLGTLPHQHKICIAGNHDACFFNRREQSEKILSNATYLQDSYIEAQGLLIYGSPWQPVFRHLPFNLPRLKLRKVWNNIPKKTDILVTHTPPFGVLDRPSNSIPLGCEELGDIVSTIRPKLHIFGHIHEGYGMVERGGTIFVNASMCNPFNLPKNKPVVIDL